MKFHLAAFLFGQNLFHGLAGDLLWLEMPVNTSVKLQLLEAVKPLKDSIKARQQHCASWVTFISVSIFLCECVGVCVCSCRVGVTVYLHVTAMKVRTRLRLSWHVFL